jgi:pSer/pThr/pTyr-binding forkhead associated (FHA) protein
LEGTNGWCDEFVIKSLPISIGRSADCDVHIPAEFSKVSRKHVVIREYNYHQGLILLEDVSTNGLIITGGDASKDPRSAAWFGIGSEIIIGASQKSPSVLITFHVR